MSSSRFYRDHARLMRAGNSVDHAQRVKEAYDAVRDKWIAERRYEELVRAIVANWTSGNCVQYMAPLSEALLRAGEHGLHRHLWSRTVKRQVATLFRIMGSLAKQDAHYLRLLNLDTAGFVETDPDAYLKPERAAAFLLQRLSRDLDRWRRELEGAHLPTTDPDQILQSVQRLKMPRIQVSRLPPGAATTPAPRRDMA